MTSVPTPSGSAQPAADAPLFVLVACEASGDLLGAGLITALRELHPGARFQGIGGDAMRAAGLDAWHDCAELAVMGLVEVLRHLPRLLRIRREVVAKTLALAPAGYIGIDGPDFNLPIERKLKAKGLRTVHYVSPSIWAWREGRAKRIQRSADLVLCLFPMEPPIYARYDAPAVFVGHPLADRFDLDPSRSAARADLGLSQEGMVLGLLPGSRIGEINRLGPTFLLAAIRLRRAYPALRLVAPMAHAGCQTAFQALLQAPPPELPGDDTKATQAEWAALAAAITLTQGRAHEVMIAADYLVLASGTAALEAMLAKRAMVVAYRVAPLTAWIVRKLGLLKINRYSLPNVLANEPVVPELMQEDCTPARIAQAVEQLVESPATQAQLIPRFVQIHKELQRDASRSAARAVTELVTPRATDAAAS